VLREFPLLAPGSQARLTHTLQIVGSERQFGGRGRDGAEKAREQRVQDTGKHDFISRPITPHPPALRDTHAAAASRRAGAFWELESVLRLRFSYCKGIVHLKMKISP